MKMKKLTALCGAIALAAFTVACGKPAPPPPPPEPAPAPMEQPMEQPADTTMDTMAADGMMDTMAAGKTEGEKAPATQPAK